jgi:hypothetical protein
MSRSWRWAVVSDLTSIGELQLILFVIFLKIVGSSFASGRCRALPD